MKTNNTFKELKQIIDESSNLLLISHSLPDGDNIGSVLAMTLALKSMGKTVTAISNGALPQYYRFLPQSDLLQEPSVVKGQESSYDLIICMDMSDWERSGAAFHGFTPSCPMMNIDHHYSNNYFGEYNYVDAKAASCTQILTEFMVETGIPITKDMATSLYTGLLTDSGSFTYQNTTEKTLLAAAVLLRTEPNLSEIRLNVFENISFKRKKILARALTNAKQICGGKITYATLNYEECMVLDADGQDFEGVIDNLIGVTDVKMGIFFREMEKNIVKVGFRGRPGVDVTAVAALFGGGGHQAAGGCTIENNFETAVSSVLKEAVAYLEG